MVRSRYGSQLRYNARILQGDIEWEGVEKHCLRTFNRLMVVSGISLWFIVLFGSKALIIPVAGLWWVFRDDLRWSAKAKERLWFFRKDFPRFISNYIIFLEAGYPVETALRRTCETGASNQIKEAVGNAFREIDNGAGRSEALGKIVEQIREPNLSKMIFLTIQGIQLGKGQMIRSLQLLSGSCWKNQLDEMKIRSEKASAKMVFPMMLIFVGISVLTLTPGILSLLQVGSK